MLHEENTIRARQIAEQFGMEAQDGDTLTLTFARTTESLTCKLALQSNQGPYVSMQVSTDLTTGERQIEQVHSDLSISALHRAAIAVAARSVGQTPDLPMRKGVFLFPAKGTPQVLRYSWSEADKRLKLIDTEDLDAGAAEALSEVANQMLATANTLEG